MCRRPLPLLLLALSFVLPACSLSYNLHDRYTFDLVDAGVDASADATPTDAAGSDAGGVPAAPVLRFPWNGYQTGSAHTASLPVPRNAMRPRFLWEPVEGAERYEIALTRDCLSAEPGSCDFGSALVYETTETDWRPPEPLPIALSAPVGSRYAWHVRACAGAPSLCSDWSQLRYLDVGRMASDFNGDGYADLAVGASAGSDPGLYQGDVFVFEGGVSGPSTSRYISVNRPVDTYLFGASISVGDLNGDGHSDLAVGSIGTGVVLIYYGSPSGIIRDYERMLSLDNFDINGESISIVGDVNGDGYMDLAAGASRANSPARQGGLVYLFLGGSRGISPEATLVLANPEDQPSGFYGTSVSGVGDMNGDGFIDVAIGASGQNTSSPNAGVVFLYHGSDVEPVMSLPLILRNPINQTGGRFGISATGSDFDGDGYSDLLIGADFQSYTAEGEGVVYFYGGGITPPSQTPDLVIENPAPQLASHFGYSLRASRDIDGDGVMDVSIGAPNHDAPLGDEGRAYVFYGSVDGLTRAPERVLDNPSGYRNGLFGFSLTGLGDVNGDGYSDLIVGAPTQNNAGQVFVYLGRERGVLTPNIVLDHPTGAFEKNVGQSLASGAP